MFEPTPLDLDELLPSLKEVRAVVFGDFCLDAYWDIDSGEDAKSLETGLAIRQVRTQRYSLGGAGNVVSNLRDLGVANVSAVGVVGPDLFGDELRRLLVARGANVVGMLRGPAVWHTAVYAKPHVRGVEGHRLDFGGFNDLTTPLRLQLEAQLAAAVRTADVVVLNQQFGGGLASTELINGINQIIAANPQVKFVVDSRHCAHQFKGAILKLNSAEAARLLDSNAPSEVLTTTAVCDYGRRVAAMTNRPVFLTRGENGLIVAQGDDVVAVPGIQIIEKTDTVGAGDTTVSALAAALGAGHGAKTAATLANIAASVTVRKLRTTGTASPAEIRKVGAYPDYIYQPDLAVDARGARYLDGTDIELATSLPDDLQIRHAIFDHDGTLSVLREGWEHIMQPMMVRAVLGDSYASAGGQLLQEVNEAVSQFIDKTTGIQTLVQMQGLVTLVKQFGMVPPNQILDEHGYKQVYNEALLEMVQKRVEKLRRGELTSVDFQIKNAASLLQALHRRGVKLYLASGTDEADVVAEAQAMGYADLFEGRIFGAVGDVNVEAKRLVLERIMREHGLQGHQFATFGDGPVEMRETRKRGGVCIGVASDEVRRFGLNPAKRARLIRAGASLVVPDFSQLHPLLNALQLGESRGES